VVTSRWHQRVRGNFIERPDSESAEAPRSRTVPAAQKRATNMRLPGVRCVAARPTSVTLVSLLLVLLEFNASGPAVLAFTAYCVRPTRPSPLIVC